MLSLVIRIVVLSSEQDSWVSCRLDEINEEEIRFVRRDGELDERIEEEEELSGKKFCHIFGIWKMEREMKRNEYG